MTLPDRPEPPPHPPTTRNARLLLPLLPFPRALPWLLAVVSAGLLAFGYWWDDSPAAVLGAVGLASVIVGFPLAALLLGRSDDGEAPPPTGPPHP
ncbi:MAG: hypothetical protein IT304_02995 [Dehalococcoidia bacterium]|nr:hypothetical protein [Dehalococcoidia bacterium]